MELKAFKGMPHEFGGIDYTEGSEVEGGEFAVQIGKSGNEYIFDKNSSEGERLSKEYKRLDKNGRLTEDDPLALETFDQIAREEALRHAQRSVNEKGIDPFRNMYEQGGQAANGGVKYATGGPMMNPAEVPNVNPGAQYNTSMSYAPMTMEDYNRQTQGESRMRDSFGTQTMRERETDKALKEATPEVEMAAQALSVLFGQAVTSFGGDDPGAMLMADMGYTSTDATKRAVGDDTMTGTAYGYGQAQSKDFITSTGKGMFSAEGGALPKDKYAQGGVKDMYSAGGGMPWTQIVNMVQEFKGASRNASKSAFDSKVADKMGEEYVRQPITGGSVGSIGLSSPQQQEGQQEQQSSYKWQTDPTMNTLQPSAMNLESSLYGGEKYINPFVPSTDPMFADPNRYSDVQIQYKKGGAKPIYGYYADGGGKKKEDESYDGMKDPVQWDIMQNYIASNDTRDRMSQAAVGSGDQMYAPYRLDNTCVAGVNCFEDLAGIPSSEGIPDDIYNNYMLRDFFESEEGKKYFRKLSDLESFFGGEKPGDYVQFERTIDPRGINYPSHIGLTTGKNRYLGDGNKDKSLYYEKIRKNPNIEMAGMEFTNVNPYFYRMLDKENRQKILEAALQAQEQGKDVIRPAFGDEEPLYLPLQQYRKNTSYPIAGF